MATINPVIVPAKVLKNGRHKVRIAIAHNGETRYILTDIIIDSDKQFKNGAIIKRPDAALLNTKLRGLVQKYQDIIDKLEYINGISCPELVFELKNGKQMSHRSIKSIVDEYLEISDIKPGTKTTYISTWRRISKYLNGSVLIECINHHTILNLVKNLNINGFKKSTIRNDITFLSTIMSYAKKCGYATYRVYPFIGFSWPQAEPRNSWLTVDEIKKLRDIEITDKKLIMCRDYFMLSYYLGGINMADLANINFNESSKYIKYSRRKTENNPKQNKFVEFFIPDEAIEIINRYKLTNGLLKMTDSQRRVRMNGFFKIHLNRLANLTGIKNLIYYSARKSFSQHAFDLGIKTCIIDYILGHRIDKGGTSLYNYIFVTPEMATQAIRKVLDNLK